MPTRLPARRLRRLALVSLLALLAGCPGSVEDRLAEARALQDAGHFSESVETLRALLEQEPELAEGWYLLGAALAQTGQPSLAVFPLEKAAAAPEHRVSAGLLLAAAFVQLEAHAEAIRAADAVLAVEPDRLTARRLRAHALLGANRREEAVVDARQLYEALPDDYDAGLLYGTILAELGRHDEAERVHAALEASARDDPDAATRACLARASFFEDHLRDDERAEAHYRRCLAAASADPLALRLASRFLDQRGRSAEALALWQRALEREPENVALRETLAARHDLAGRLDEARALLREGVEAIGSEAAWLALVELERRHGETDAALRALAEAERLQARRDEQLLFLKGDLLVGAGRLDEAEALLAQFQDASYHDLLRGAVLLARGEARAAQGALDAGLRRWPNNAGARYLAGLAARELGDFERAVAELRESVRADAAATDAALLLAGLESARGEHRAALDAARAFLDHRSGSRAEGLRLAIRSQSALGLHDAARRSLEELRAAGFPMEAALAAAEVESTAAGGGSAGAAAGAASLRSCGLDPAAPGHEALLRALTERLLAAGRGAEALAAVDGALARDAERASLHELRGAVLLRLARPADAQAAFEAALARDAAQGRAQAGLAALAWARGDVEAARALYDEAARALPDDPTTAYAAAQIALVHGDRAGARRRLEDLVRRQPGHAAARNDLAWLLASEGQDLERALALAALAHRLDPSPEFADTLGFVHLQRGESERAAALFEEALAARPESQSMRFHLGLALARAGERERAVAALRAALAPGPFPEADTARAELARLERP